MKLYIDPGTGSMLFAVLLGVIGAANYLIRKWIVKIRFALNGGKNTVTNNNKIPVVIFSDDKRYWKNFLPVCKELDRRNVDVKYYTASEDDPALDNPFTHISAEYIGSGNKAYARLNFLNAGIVLATTPGLDVYQWKRSKDVDFYVHMLHMASDPSLYRMFGLDYYDAVLLSGDYQIDEIRKLEELRGLSQKELVKVGIPYMDDMLTRFRNDEKPYNSSVTVLLAPSWGDSAIFSRFGGKIIDELLKTDCHIIVRPHPQSFSAEKELMDKLMKDYPTSERLEWNRDNDNYEVLKKSDILISDFSGVVFEFSLIYDKPVIYTNTEFDKGPYDAWWLSEEPWTFKSLPLIGEELTEDNLSDLSMLIDKCLDNPQYGQNRQELREETWAYIGEGARRVAVYIIEKAQSLKEKDGSAI